MDADFDQDIIGKAAHFGGMSVASLVMVASFVYCLIQGAPLLSALLFMLTLGALMGLFFGIIGAGICSAAALIVSIYKN